MKYRNIIVNLLKVIFAFVLVIWLIQSDRLDFSFLLTCQINLLLISAFLLVLLDIFLQSIRWWWFLRSQHINIPLIRAISLMWITSFFMFFLPGTLSGEIIRGYYIVRDYPKSKTASLSTVFVDRLVGFFSLFLLGAFCALSIFLLNMPTPGLIKHSAIFIFIFIIVTFIATFLLFYPKTQRFMFSILPGKIRANIRSILVNYRLSLRIIMFGILISFLSHLTGAGYFVIISHYLDSAVSFLQVLIIRPFIIIANFLPITPGGLGVGETTSSVLFNQYNITTGAEIVLVSRVLNLLARLPGGIIFLFYKKNIQTNFPALDSDSYKA